MKDSESFSLLDVGLPVELVEGLPPLAQLLRDLRVVFVRMDLDNLSPFQLRPDHEGVHGPLDVIGCVLLRLEDEKME
jgi:hypothetical protein